MAEEKNGKEMMENVVSEADALPKAIVRRVVKDKLSQLSADSDISVLRDSLQAFSESSRIFIHYLSATANDICKESNRQVINPEDVFKALEEIEYPEFIGPLRAALEEFREKNAGRKSSKGKDTNKKAEKKEPPNAKETNKKAERKNPSKAKDSNKKAEKKEQPKAKDTNKKAEKKGPPKAKDTNEKAKRKEPPSPSEGQKKRHVVESDGDKDSD